MSSAIVRVAPREIDDYVTWAARVSGCAPGLAGRIAAAVTFAELHYGEAVGAFVKTLSDGLATSDFALAPTLVISGEVAARSRGTGKVVFDTPVRFAAVARPLDEALARGAVCRDLPPSTGSLTELTALTLVKASKVDSEVDAVLARRADAAAAAYREGLSVDRVSWNCLVDAAKNFRVSEQVLDAAES